MTTDVLWDKKAACIARATDFVFPELVGIWIIPDLPLKIPSLPNKIWDNHISFITTLFLNVAIHSFLSIPE